MNKWISVKDRLLEQRDDILVATENGDVFLCDYIPSVNEFWSGDYMIQAETITHWMPLPEPPEVKDGNT